MTLYTHLYAPYGLPVATATSNWLANITVAALFTTLGTTVLALRLANTLLRGRPVGPDDLAMHAAFVAAAGYTVASVIALRWGVGLHNSELPAGWAVQALKATYAVEIFYYMAVFGVKVSILCMYLRLSTGLGKGNRLRMLTSWMLALLGFHFVSTVVVTGVQCRPMPRFWNPEEEKEGDCINITAFFYSTNVFTILTDLLILALPMRTFWKMQMPSARKAGVIAIFAVGGVSTIASCVRLYSVRMFMSKERGLEDAAPINTWSFVEIYLGIFCASVPAIKTLFIRDRRPRTPSASTTPSGDGRRPGTRSYWSCFTKSAAPKSRTDASRRDDDVELGDVSQGRYPKQRQAQLGLQSAVMTSSQGSLRNYRTLPGSHGTT